MKNIYNLKRYAIYVLSMFVTILWTGCENTVLNLEPVDNFYDTNAFSSPERCELAVIGAYDAAQCGLYSNGTRTRGYPFGAASIILSEMRGEDMNLTQTFYNPVYSSTINLSTGNIVSMWETSFEAINRYNVVIQGIEEAGKAGVITNELKEQYLGECYFLRALTYHNLMVHFAYPYNIEGNNNYGLPVYLTPTTSPDQIEEHLNIGRSSVKDTYTQILTDLENAEHMLPETIGESPISRASKGAAIALKTRVYLHERNWGKVIEEAVKLKEGIYSLEPDPATPFISFSSNKESIFSIANSATDNGGVNGAMSAMFNAHTGGRAMCPTSPILYNSKFWREDDKRRNLLYYRESDKYYWCDKYTHGGVYDEWAPIIRYAEVLLNQAEAEARLEHKTEALALLNEVRNRSLDDYENKEYKEEDFNSIQELVEAILWERRIEFHGEGRRWEDIHRLAADDLCPTGGIPAKIEYSKATGKGAFVIGGELDPDWLPEALQAVPYTDRRFLWPIPQNDLIRNPKLAEQQNLDW